MNYYVGPARHVLTELSPSPKHEAFRFMRIWQDGVITGITAFAVYKDGTQVCGVRSTPLPDERRKVIDAVDQVLDEKWPPKPNP